jgi:hypothetical protein
MPFVVGSTPIFSGCFTMRRWCAALLSVVLLAIAPGTLRAQTFDVSGFVKSSYLYDTRQVVAARDLDFLLWPQPNVEPEDDQTTRKNNLGAFQLFSRVGLDVGGFETTVLGAEVRGYLEADFFGPGTVDAAQENLFRLRRGFAEMNWTNRSVLFGLEWSPLFTLAAYPHTVATEAGTPFNPFARQPMIKLTLKPGPLRFIGAVAWQFDAFRSDDFLGTGGIDQQQLASLPGLHGQVQYTQGALTVGGGGHLKALRPVPTGDRIFTGAALGYLAYDGETWALRTKGVFGGDLHDHVKTSGIVYDPARDPEGAFASEAFQALNSFSAWVEIERKGRLAPGLFAGFLTNLGAFDSVSSPAAVTATGRGTNIAALWGVSPRLVFNLTPMRFALELQVTRAAFADAFDGNYAPSGTTRTLINARGNFSVFLLF